MARLPHPGGDSGEWGDLLNEYLLQTHESDGSLRDEVVTNAQVSSMAAIDQSKIANLTTDLASKASIDHAHMSSQITDATVTGRAVLTAANAAAARAAIGAGTGGAIDDVRVTGGNQLQFYSSGTPVGSPISIYFSPRIQTVISSSAPTINTDSLDMFGITALAENIISMTIGLSGTPVDGQRLWVYIVGTSARTITWGAGYENGVVSLPLATVGTQRLDVGFVWNAAASKWRCMASGTA